MNITAIRIIADSDGLELDEELDFIEEVYYDLASFVTVWVGLICTGLVGKFILLVDRDCLVRQLLDSFGTI